MISQPNLLLIAGTGRNVGKTSLACALIDQTSISHKVIGVKISPHFHQISPTEKPIIKSENFEIIEELNSDGNKDSSRMLKAGASRVFYVQTKSDIALIEVMKELQQFWFDDTAVICESGGLRHFIEPGLFMVCRSADQPEIKPHLNVLEPKVDQFILFQENGFDLSRVKFENHKWSIIEAL
ncbi:MAG: hypothetical protein KKG99_01790 [Bacteroidetes bacterium]|nr:hypothetical protein [Bacteroidota bacterium]